MLAPKQNLPADQRKLLKLYSGLSQGERENLLAFAEFLSQREEGEVATQQIAEPKPIPGPEEESVIAAIKRLSETYHMLDRSTLFHETSSLMTSHVMQGREAVDVIDELEALFQTKYQQLTETGD
ncbi:Crp/Fnr family transcriptional regulator [Solemya velesiana gill symbiont]|uniref:Crp/Fnr family transcriptional regulator n=1 Tax=Solemya velesiana gill symbiont TaxID=1918948 RepID=A0A1T2KWN3_9GAMM|nr:Crp/Fnr family transcriptional regulator [Solemya velesiana gill symbiont]